jgi:hypothetical protein
VIRLLSKVTIIIGIVLLLSELTLAKTLECEILQYKSGRLYFPLGVDDNVYSGCFFTIFDGSDSVGCGYIENSLASVSESEPMTIEIDSTHPAKYVIKIDAAEIETDRPVNIGIQTKDYVQQFVPFLESRLDSRGARFAHLVSNIGDRETQFISYASLNDIIRAYENKEIDGFITYKDNSEFAGSSNTFSYQAPWYVALIPNFENNTANHSTLTTALYYFFNHDLFNIYFEGDNITPYNCHYHHAENCERYYGYNPVKGKRLMSIVGNRRIRVDGEGRPARLGSTIRYFRDIVSRNSSQDKESGIITASVEFIPIYTKSPFGIDYSATGSAEYIVRFIANHFKDAIDRNRSLKESVELIRGYIELYKKSDNKDRQDKYINEINRGLIEDLGIFPLFRPTVYFTFNENIKGVGLTDEGYLDLDRLKLIKMPVSAMKDN